MDDPNTMPERMREIEIFGVPALYTNTPSTGSNLSGYVPL